ncbi:helix-turn-helix domain-containing protein [Mycolicibacter sinensis]|uniref:helix-turn-helix domain-containing protein n=1 Tax=Mycolicibacter sinensis (strain JDM601) TaxID=875328 RepID=UPI0007EB8907|nr:helix-turn-helix domain-containing protein [Mycolicibacter sinensis]OBH19939.1 hypothetical protein A5694_01165 [Mycolicibacter sinensis]
MGTALHALLAKHQIGLTSDEVLAELDSGFAALAGAGAEPLSTAEADFLGQHTGIGAAVDDWSPITERSSRSRAAVRELAEALSGSVTIKEAAAILGVNRSQVSRLITRGTLWAFDLRSRRRIPRWQFLDAGLLPGLATIVPAIQAGTTPAVMDAFMRTAQPDFEDRTPIDYLAAGGDSALIAGFLADLEHW